jgi:hypothetical protein
MSPEPDAPSAIDITHTPEDQAQENQHTTAILPCDRSPELDPPPAEPPD